MKRRRINGFTAMEVMIVIIGIGLLSSLVVGGFINVIPAGKEANAVNKARVINAARLTYALTVPDSATQWAGCATDADKASLLVTAGTLTGTGSDWLTSSGGYSLSLTGSLKSKTLLRDKDGNALAYPD